MAPFLKKYHDETYASMRIIIGLLFMCHGMSKLFGWPEAPPDAPLPIIYIAGSIETFGGCWWRLACSRAGPPSCAPG